ncbi:hypothetical protein CEXT_726651 [Caerostris extrusa]|uniref:Uncharacterized protein n=1 Tax=Caerostris extrusa TaxID=172846 RepID=A0AAV4U3Q6_CAEEX|nr:hypothetical protein CEXT_726651 [Caerostris extrusa]
MVATLVQTEPRISPLGTERERKGQLSIWQMVSLTDSVGDFRHPSNKLGRTRNATRMHMNEHGNSHLTEICVGVA